MTTQPKTAADLDAYLSDLLEEDFSTQLSRDAGRVYEIELSLRRPSLVPVARLQLQRERARLLVAS